MSPHEELQLEVRLRDVPVPPRLFARLNEIVTLSDRELDAQVCDVPVPEGLTQRIQRIVLDEWIEERLRDVEPPPATLPRVRNIPYTRARTHLGRLALAAGLLVAVGVGYLAGLTGLLSLFRPTSDRAAALAAVDSDAAVLYGGWQDNGDGAAIAFMDTESPFPGSEVAVSTGESTSGPKIDLVDAFPPSPEESIASVGGVGGLSAADLGQSVPETVEVLGASGEEIGTLDLVSVDQVVSEGMELPVALGFDREFALHYGVNPPVFLGLDDSLTTCSPPLSTSTQSFDLMRYAVERGEAWQSLGIPIRTEDFLAAMDPHSLGLAEDENLARVRMDSLGIRTAVGPSLGSQSAELLQIAISAPSLAQAKRAARAPATHLVVCLDYSEAMRWQHRFDIARTALERLLSQLPSADRMSLVVFQEGAVKLFRLATRDDAAAVSEKLRRLPLYGNGAPEAGIREAIELLQPEADASESTPSDVRLVLITASEPVESEQDREVLRELLAETRQKHALKLDIFDLASTADLSGWEEIAGDTPVQVTSGTQDATEMLRRLKSLVVNGSSLAAANVSLTVEFDPKAVLAYRLLGHELSEDASLTATPGLGELHYGEETTALFEVWLKANSEDRITKQLITKQLITKQLKVTWDGDDKPSEIGGAVTRLQASTSFDGAALPLQAAAIAAELAERLKPEAYQVTLSNEQSYSYSYSAKPRGFDDLLNRLDQLLNRLEQADPVLRENPAYQQLADLMYAAESAGISGNQVATGNRRWTADVWVDSPH